MKFGDFVKNRQKKIHPQAHSRSVSVRVFDLGVVIILSPLWVIAVFLTGLVITVLYGRPVLYISNRIGMGGAEFKIWKFRTLDDQQKPVGAFSNWLRRTHLDELPQLVHVLAGTMALVGPRPLVPKDHFSLPHYAKRESILPGITGPWQIMRSAKLDYSDMEEFDEELFENWSLVYRIRILISTFGICVRAFITA